MKPESISDVTTTNRTALQNAIPPATTCSTPWAGKDGKMYRSFRYWLIEGWSQSFLQVQVGQNWQTLY